MNRLAALILLLALAACGVDGPPVAPGPQPGVSVTGDAYVGMRYEG